MDNQITNVVDRKKNKTETLIMKEDIDKIYFSQKSRVYG